MDELVVRSDHARRDYINSEAAKIAVLLIPRVREGRGDLENTIIGELARVRAPYDVRQQLVKEFQEKAPDLLTQDVEDSLAGRKVSANAAVPPWLAAAAAKRAKPA